MTRAAACALARMDKQAGTVMRGAARIIIDRRMTCGGSRGVRTQVSVVKNPETYKPAHNNISSLNLLPNNHPTSPPKPKRKNQKQQTIKSARSHPRHKRSPPIGMFNSFKVIAVPESKAFLQ